MLREERDRKSKDMPKQSCDDAAAAGCYNPGITVDFCQTAYASGTASASGSELLSTSFMLQTDPASAEASV